MDQSELKQIIKEAFSDVRLGDGVGLREGQVLDDYGSEEERRKTRLSDEKDDWESLPPDDLNECSSSLCFFDPEGMRFHLPAYMILALNQRDETHVLSFYLDNRHSHTSGKFSNLTDQQRHAVVLYLEWCLSQPEHEFDALGIQRTLDNFWRNDR